LNARELRSIQAGRRGGDEWRSTPGAGYVIRLTPGIMALHVRNLCLAPRASIGIGFAKLRSESMQLVEFDNFEG
jgi:hypothetical protein